MTTTDSSRPAWTPVSAGLPPITDDMLQRSEKLLVATDEMTDGITFAYCYLDEEEGATWRTACRDGLDLTRVTHYAARPALPA